MRVPAQHTSGPRPASSTDATSSARPFGLAPAHEPGGAAAPGRVLPLHGERVIEAPLIDIAAVLADYAGSRAWVADCVQSELLEIDGEAVLYNRIHIGMGFADRDVVLTPTLTRVDTPRGQGVCSRVVARRCLEVPSPRGCLRMPELVSEIVLEPLDARRVRAHYSARVCPGGWVPDSIVPWVSRRLPRRTLAALARCAAMPRDGAATARLAARLGVELAPPDSLVSP